MFKHFIHVKCKMFEHTLKLLIMRKSLKFFAAWIARCLIWPVWQIIRHLGWTLIFPFSHLLRNMYTYYYVIVSMQRFTNIHQSCANEGYVLLSIKWIKDMIIYYYKAALLNINYKGTLKIKKGLFPSRGINLFLLRI